VRRLAYATTLAATAALIACVANPPPPPTATGVGLQATFILANPEGLLALDAQARTLGRIVDLPPQSAPATPALHPSGKSIVFALTGQPNKKTGFGSDLYLVSLDGTGLRPIDATGNILYFHRRAALIQAGSFVGNEDSLERLDLRTGERRRLLMNGADPTISTAGDRTVYVHLTQGQPDSLWVANIDGTNARAFFTTRDTWWYLQAPRFSPKGCQLVFSAAGHATSSDQPGLVAGSGRAGLAHLNIPSGLFLAPCDGSSVRSIATTSDDVVPAWSPDGTQVAYVGSGGFFAVEVASGNVRTVAQGQTFFFGDLVWVK
jgi:Tol biopolymer transport system component